MNKLLSTIGFYNDDVYSITDIHPFVKESLDRLNGVYLAECNRIYSLNQDTVLFSLLLHACAGIYTGVDQKSKSAITIDTRIEMVNLILNVFNNMMSGLPESIIRSTFGTCYKVINYSKMLLAANEVNNLKLRAIALMLADASLAMSRNYNVIKNK